MTIQEKALVRVVLVGARNPQNIGAAARAMQDFGFKDLRLVNEYRVPLEEARSAVGAADLLATAVECGSVAEAVADCQLVVGTTAVGEREIAHRLVGLVEGGAEIVGELKKQVPFGDDNKKDNDKDSISRVALLFGSEKTGLTTEQLSHCDWLVTIPMAEVDGARHLSMNLGQAVAVCLYELVRAEGSVAVSEVQAATSGEVERMTELLRKVMEATEYTRRFPTNCDESDVRQLVKRMRLSAKDTGAWMGVLRQLMWKLKQPRP